MTRSGQRRHPSIARLLVEVGGNDPRAAIRTKARELVTLYVQTFGEPTMPINVEELASLRGIVGSDEPPAFSKDAELVPDGQGGVTMRVNPDRPETRRRFSIGHEITHTFFAGYQLKVQCRPDSRYRDRNNPDDAVEMLCDVGASELLMPLPWFRDDAGSVRTGAALVALAWKYRASREATARRFAEISESAIAAIFLSWKLKPTQKKAFNPRQATLLGTTTEEEARAARQLRIDYSIPSDAFAARNLYLPSDKSLVLDGPIEAAAKGEPAEGEAELELGQSRGRYRVIAIPVFTDKADLGPGGESGIIALVEPMGSFKRAHRKKAPSGPDLFSDR